MEWFKMDRGGWLATWLPVMLSVEYKEMEVKLLNTGKWK